MIVGNVGITNGNSKAQVTLEEGKIIAKFNDQNPITKLQAATIVESALTADSFEKLGDTKNNNETGKEFSIDTFTKSK